MLLLALVAISKRRMLHFVHSFTDHHTCSAAHVISHQLTNKIAVGAAWAMLAAFWMQGCQETGPWLQAARKHHM